MTETIDRIIQFYRGIRVEELEEMNPEYSCVICTKFKECGQLKSACIENEPMTEEQFSLSYDF